MFVRDNGKQRKKLRRIDFFFPENFYLLAFSLSFKSQAALPNQMSSLSSWG